MDQPPTSDDDARRRFVTAGAGVNAATHLFTEDRVFKLLRPVQLGPADLRTSHARREALEAELAAGDRLAPVVHLGITPIPEGEEVTDWMLVMRRLADEDRLTEIVRRRALTDDHLRDIARAIAAFHEAQPPVFGPEARQAASRDTHDREWRILLTVLHEFTGAVLDRPSQLTIDRLVHDYLEGRGRLFERRIEDGLIREGHGALRARDVFVVDGAPQILGMPVGPPVCRTVDVLDDIASLAIDIHRFAGPISAQSLIRYYCEFAGEHHPSSLAHHFVAQHAARRCVEALEEVVAGRHEFAAVARMYHRLVLDQLHRGAVRMALVGGGPGTGKTMVAQELAIHLGWTLLSSDEVRRSVSAPEPRIRPATVDTGRYTPSVTDATYTELTREAALLLEMGESVILDASWTAASKRAAARRVAHRTRTEIFEFECTIDEPTASERVVRRLADQWNTSDASAPVVTELRTRRDAWPEAQPVSTDDGTHPAVATARAVVERSCDDPGGLDVVLPSVQFWATVTAEEAGPST